MNSVLRIVLQRLGLGVVTLVVVSFVIFVAVNAMPGDFAQAILGQGYTEEAGEAIRREVGLDKPYFVRYFSWLGAALTGDFGTSFAKANFAAYAGNTAGSGLDTVAASIAPRLENTLFLAGVAAMIAVPISLVLGLLAALYRNTIFDRFTNIFTLSPDNS